MDKPPFQGKRLLNTVFGELPEGIEPGTYWKYMDRVRTNRDLICAEEYFNTNLIHTVWGYMPPNGKGVGTLMKHTVRENEDGTITVAPNDGASNSILHTRREDEVWHGYIDHGVWKEI